MKIVSVLRTGVEYGVDQAHFLHDQLPANAVCMTNLPDITGIETVALEDPDLIGWWAKMELFNPDGPLGGDDLFYIDLDTVVVGDIKLLMDAARGSRNLVMLSDFYHPEHPASGVMYIPVRAKQRIWKAWSVNPYWFMLRRRDGARGGDQGFIAENAGQIMRWDDLCPGAIISYKKHIAARGMPGYTAGMSMGDGSLPKGAVMVAFHGNPRPWDIKPCKPSSSATIPASNGSANSNPPSQRQPPLLITGTKGRSKATSRRSKSRAK